MEQGRWEFFQQAVKDGKWRTGQHFMNNMLRRFKTLCRRSGAGAFTIHDLRRSCITNWAQHLPIHVVQELGGHSSIKTTQQFYLSVQMEDMRKAQSVQAAVLAGIPEARSPDQELTNSARKRVFPGKKAFEAKTQAPD